MKATSMIVSPGKPCRLDDHDPDSTGEYKEKKDVLSVLEKDLATLSDLQTVLYAQNTYSVLIILQAMDAAGKDSVIKHVMSGVNPQGVVVRSFKAPSAGELDHDYLWRHVTELPRRGEIGIFNRSYYEEVLVVRVHPEILEHERLPEACRGKSIWKQRYEDINNHEKFLANNGTVILKFFLNVSRKEQRSRFLDRIDQPEKHWKFSAADLRERTRWDDYMQAYQEMLGATSTDWAPWHVIPADHKWFTRVAVADVIVKKLASLDLRFPSLTEEQQRDLSAARKELEKES
jgi:PPK2 family polyphosphate:nucleotide phosphotransferase